MMRKFCLIPVMACLATTLLLVAPKTARADLPVTFLELDAVPGAFYGWGVQPDHPAVYRPLRDGQ